MALEISLCDLWMENQISYLAQTWHTCGKEKDWSDFKLYLFSCPIWTWYERLLLHSAGRENKCIVQESNFQHINGKLKKMHQNRRLHIKNINSLHSPFGLGQPLTESIALKWMTSGEWKWCIKVVWGKKAKDIGPSPVAHVSCCWNTVEMDGRRQEEVIYLRRLLTRPTAKAKGKYRGLIEKYNQIPISFFWAITVFSGINLTPLLYISFFQPHFQRSESLHQCVLEQQLCYLRTWMLLCFTELSNRQCFKESQGKSRLSKIIFIVWLRDTHWRPETWQGLYKEKESSSRTQSWVGLPSHPLGFCRRDKNLILSFEPQVNISQTRMFFLCFCLQVVKTSQSWSWVQASVNAKPWPAVEH